MQKRKHHRPPLKIVFLDFDGVLNSQLFYLRLARGEIPTHDRSLAEGNIDPISIQFLNNLLSETGAFVVVSSTWRLGRTVEELQSILDSCGFTGKVIGKTKDLRRGDGADSIFRGNEIIHWIKENENLIGSRYWGYKNYVIFDDDTDMLLWQKDNFIKTDPYCGLTPTNTYKAKKILKQ